MIFTARLPQGRNNIQENLTTTHYNILILHQIKELPQNEICLTSVIDKNRTPLLKYYQTRLSKTFRTYTLTKIEEADTIYEKNGVRMPDSQGIPDTILKNRRTLFVITDINSVTSSKTLSYFVFVVVITISPS
ncbi:hypothetical protein [Endozoicomonas sp. ALE010]|uniref:hypothetical protein n=1 Tax=Endozoicomonas sp. ALE010 TaxID=3403081 RepID=UPI003BB6F3A6